MRESGTTVSRYLVVGNREYEDRHGRPVRVVYGTRLGRLLVVPTVVAGDLAAGVVPVCSPAVARLLTDSEILVKEQDERQAVLARSAEAAEQNDVRTFVLFPTSYCNMGCDYCGQAHVKGQLGPRHRDMVAARVLGAVAAADTTLVRVQWFGAEPMLAYGVIRQLATRFVSAARDAGVRYESMVITNGTLLSVDKMAELHGRCGVQHIEVTLDGLGEVHDGHRPLKAGGQSFAAIVAVLVAALADPRLSRLSLGLRSNVDARNLDAIPEYLAYMARAGFADPRVKFKFAPVHSWSNDISQIELQVREFAAAEAGWLRLMQEHGLRADFLPTEPIHNLCVATTRAAEVISSTGNLFSCVEYPLVPEHEANDALIPLAQLGVTERRPAGAFDTWVADLPTAGTGCAACVFLGVCGGRCPKLWKAGAVPCPSYKFNVQDRMHLAAIAGGLATRTSDSHIRAADRVTVRSG